MVESEIHLFIIWEKALFKKDKILNHLRNNFEILSIYNMVWSLDKFSENLSRFYGENLPKNSFKEKHCGTGPFFCIIVKDNNPKYDVRETSKGWRVVNVRTFDAKQLYREWTGGGHKIHATDTQKESNLQLILLFGEDSDYFLSKKPQKNIINWEKDLVGANGWKSLEEIFEIMNKTIKYVILRNFDNIEQELNAKHPDIDMLVEDKNLAVQILNGTPTTNKKWRVQYQVKISNRSINFDLRHVGDNYYPSDWERNILRRRKKFRKFFIPSSEDQFYSLLYHMLIHKKEISKDYYYKILHLSKEINLNLQMKNLTDENLDKILFNYLDNNNYKIVEPKDLTVHFNEKYFKYTNLSLERKIFFWKEQLLKKKIFGVYRKLKDALLKI